MTECLHFKHEFESFNGDLSGRCLTCGKTLNHQDVVAAAERAGRVTTALNQLRSAGNDAGVQVVDTVRELHDLHQEYEQHMQRLQDLDKLIEAKQSAIKPIVEKFQIPEEVAKGDFEALVAHVVQRTELKALPQ